MCVERGKECPAPVPASQVHKPMGYKEDPEGANVGSHGGCDPSVQEQHGAAESDVVGAEMELVDAERKLAGKESELVGNKRQLGCLCEN